MRERDESKDSGIFLRDTMERSGKTDRASGNGDRQR